MLGRGGFMRTKSIHGRTARVLAMVGGLTLIAGACGSDAKSSSTPASSAAAPAATTAVTAGAASDTSAAATGGDSGEVSAAQGVVDAALKSPTAINQTVPLTGKVEQGRTYVFLQCELPQCKAIGDGALDAAKTIGWKTKVIPWQTTDPSTLTSALNQALQFNPIAVTPTGFPQEFWGTVIPAYEKAGVMIVPAAVANLTISKTVPGGASTAFDYAAAGKIMGNWLIADSKAEAHILVMDVPAYEVLKTYGDAAKAVLAKGCAKCVVTPLDITLPQLSSNGVIPAIVAALQKDPSINYLVGTDGAFLGGIQAAMSAANITKVKIAGGAPAITNLQNLVNGTEAAWTGEAISQMGWTIVDIAARASLGMKIPEADLGRPQQLLVKANVGTPTDSLDAPADYRDQYKKLWGIG